MFQLSEHGLRKKKILCKIKKQGNQLNRSRPRDLIPYSQPVVCTFQTVLLSRLSISGEKRGKSLGGRQMVFFFQSFPFTDTVENFHISLVKVHGNHPSSLPLACGCTETCLASYCTPFNTSFLHDFPFSFAACGFFSGRKETVGC